MPPRLKTSTVNLITGGLLCGFIGGVFLYTTRAVKQDDISAADIENFQKKREAKAKQ